MLSYRGYGKSGGDPDEAGLKLDAHAALDYIKQDPILSATKVIVYGQSIGGAVAISLASEREHDIDALILENTFLSLVSPHSYRQHKLVPQIMPAVAPILKIAPFFLYLRFFYLNRNQIWNSEASLAKIKKIPVCFLSGSIDTLVPPSHMRALYRGLKEQRGEREEDCSLQWSEFIDGGHNDTVMQATYFLEIDRFWKRFI
jgi:fermentation-respiration switch protein FrsA (DUF1100 family)